MDWPLCLRGVQKIQSMNSPASISNTAGTFVCNHVTYGVCHLLATKYPDKRSGFIHIPYLPQQVLDKKNMPSMSQEMMVEAITVCGGDKILLFCGKCELIYQLF